MGKNTTLRPFGLRSSSRATWAKSGSIVTETVIPKLARVARAQTRFASQAAA